MYSGANMKFIAVLVIITLVACNNKVDTQVPAEITVKVPETTQTVNVIHTVELSVKMEEFFRSSCTTQVDAAPVPLPEPQRSAAIDACVATSVQQFIQNMLEIINQNSNTGAN